ncbi:MAG: M23 family metallopeptidase, partial [Oscillospiraceae bacterium]|nr:M23 family metallopeptidase [Oscillospiraceae bacterium]
EAEELEKLEKTVVSVETVQHESSSVLGLEFFFPLPEGTDYNVTKTFSPVEPIHAGLDLTAAAGTELYAPMDGEIILASNEVEKGNTVSVWNQSTRTTVTYSHCDELLVKAGDTVKAGQAIATLGKTGNATGNCLHIEVEPSTSYYTGNADPARYFPELKEYAYTITEQEHVWEEILNLPYSANDYALTTTAAAVHVLEQTTNENAATQLEEYLDQLTNEQIRSMSTWWPEVRERAQSLLTDSRDAILEEIGYGAADLSAYSVEGLSDLDSKVLSALFQISYEREDMNTLKLSSQKMSYNHNDQYYMMDTSIPPLETPCANCGGTMYYIQTWISDMVGGYSACVDGADDHGDQRRERKEIRDYSCVNCGQFIAVEDTMDVAVHLDGFPSWWGIK